MLNGIEDIVEWLVARDIEHEITGPGTVVLSASLNGRDAALVVAWLDGEVVQLSHALTRVPRHRRDEVAVALARLNAELALPGLVLDGRGAVWFRLGLFCDGGLAASALERGITTCLRTAAAVDGELLAVVEPPLSDDARSRSAVAAEVLGYLI